MFVWVRKRLRGYSLTVLLLQHEETVRLEPSRLAELYLKYGEDRAERLLSEAVEDIALALSRLSRLGPHGSLTEIADIALGLSENATQCGMLDLANVAISVRKAAAQIDLAALGATMARVSRVGDRSLAAIWGPCNAQI